MKGLLEMNIYVFFTLNVYVWTIKYNLEFSATIEPRNYFVQIIFKINHGVAQYVNLNYGNVKINFFFNQD